MKKRRFSFYVPATLMLNVEAGTAARTWYAKQLNICQYCLKSVDGYLEEGEEQWFCQASFAGEDSPANVAPHCGEENLN